MVHENRQTKKKPDIQNIQQISSQRRSTNGQEGHRAMINRSISLFREIQSEFVSLIYFMMIRLSILKTQI